MSDAGVTAEAAQQRVMADTQRLQSGSGIVRGVHGLIWVRGADAVSFVEALISQSVEGAEPGSVRPSFLLTPQGKVRAYLWVLRSVPDEVGLITQATTVETVIEDLTRFRFRVAAELELDTRPVVTLVGIKSEAALLAADLPRPTLGWLQTAEGLVAEVAFATAAIPRYVLVGDAAVAIAHTAGEAVPAAYEAVRVSAPEPLGNVDFDDSTIAHELGTVEHAVDFTKGCYLGQELIARIDSRGRVTRRLRHVVADAAITGAQLSHEGATVGTVTSSAGLADGTHLGLALVRHHIEPGQTIDAFIGDKSLPATIREVTDT